MAERPCHEFERSLLKALRLENRHIVEMSVTLSGEHPPRVVVTELAINDTDVMEETVQHYRLVPIQHPADNTTVYDDSGLNP